MLTKNLQLERLDISLSLLTADFCKLSETLESANEWGVDMIHCDVMDGCYVPNLTFGMKMVADIRKYTKLPLDVHLMINEPEKYVEQFCDAGADIVTFHPEVCSDVFSTIKAIKDKGKKVGLAVNADVSMAVVLPYIEMVDLILIMTVQAGFGGQKFNEQCLRKVRKAQELKVLHDYTYDIEVDGGINNDTAILAKRAGATIAVAGNYIISAEDKLSAVHSLYV